MQMEILTTSWPQAVYASHPRTNGFRPRWWRPNSTELGWAVPQAPGIEPGARGARAKSIHHARSPQNIHIYIYICMKKR